MFPVCINQVKENNMSETWAQVLTIIGSNLIIILTFFGVSISLHNGMREEVRAIHDEIKDFHGRLERQDAEFKAHLINHEEQRNKK